MSFISRISASVLSLAVVCMAMVPGCAPSGPTGNDNTGGSNENSNNSGEPRCVPTDESGETTVSYNLDLVPLFANAGCLTSACHTGSFPQSSYNLESYEGTFGPGDQAEIFNLCNIVPGDADASYLIEKLEANPRSGVRMPQGLTPLTDDEIEMIRTWIAEGAQDN